MSDPILTYADQASQDPTDQSLSATLARRYRDTLRDLESLRAKYQDAQKQLNAVVHERDGLLEAQGKQGPRVAGVPALSVWCNEPGCPTPPLTIAQAPPDEFVGQWVTGRGWQWVDEGEQYCVSHKRQMLNCRECGVLCLLALVEVATEAAQALRRRK